MLKAYKIGIEIAATNTAGSVIRILGRDLGGLGKQAGALTARLRVLKIAAIGAVAAMGGVALVKATWRLAQYGDKLAEVQSRLRQMGVSGRNVGALTNAAFTQSMRTPNVDWADALAALTKARTVLGSSAEARRAAGPIVRAEGVLANWGMGGPTALGELLKAIELRGGTYGPDGKTFSVAALTKNLGYALAAQNIAGKLLTPNVIMRTTKLAGPAAQLMSPWAWWSSMAEAAQQMGPGAGRGFAMTMKEFTGGPISRLYAYNLKKYGLVAPGGFVKIPHTFQTAVKPGALKGQSLLYNKGLFAWVSQVLVPTLEAHGVHGRKALIAAVNQTINAQTGARLVANMVTNALSYLRTQKQMRQSMGVSIFGVQMNSAMGAPLKALSGALDTFLQTIGRPLVPVAIRILHGLTYAVLAMTKWAKVHPAIVKAIAIGIGVLGAALIGFGTAVVIGALATLGGVPALIAGAVLAVVTGVTGLCVAFPKLAHALDGVAGAVKKIIYFETHPWADIKAIGHALTPRPSWDLNNYAPGHAGMIGRPAAVPGTASAGAYPATPVHVTNAHDIAKAVHHGLVRSLGGNQGGTTGFNGRMSPFGTPAFTGP